MSWSTQVPVVSEDNLEDLHNAEAPGQELSDEAKEQFAIAKEAAELLIKSGALGSGKKFQVGLSGHANPKHEPTEGWANDSLSISLGQLHPDVALPGTTERDKALAQEKE